MPLNKDQLERLERALQVPFGRVEVPLFLDAAKTCAG
ncbi:hypothetical protein PCA31118_00033 [Pandoraea captiosa]|uniref:Uncharacterized protein n=1 Tax=Pandoraea captiosa TaxID=2508302 RepID=A0A5E4ZHP0_9BURK|nr:hypothetical protein PCA31118_00033 [Pandoraea captiosa]